MNAIEELTRPVLSIAPYGAVPAEGYCYLGHIPLPAKRRVRKDRSAVGDLLEALVPGECLQVPDRAARNNALTVARRRCIRVTSRVMEDGRILIWRIS